MSPLTRSDSKLRTVGLRLAAVLLAVSSSACLPRVLPVLPATAPVDLPVPIQAHLFCIDCTGEEADSVALLLGDAAIPYFEEVLRGPPAEYQAAARVRLSTMWERAARYRIERGEAPATTEAAYVSATLPNFVASVQTSAAWGLAAIGTSDANDVLQAVLDAYEAGSLSLRSDVVRAVQGALAAM